MDQTIINTNSEERQIVTTSIYSPPFYQMIENFPNPLYLIRPNTPPPIIRHF